MQGNDLSNQMGAAVVIDVEDLIFEWEKTMFTKRLKLKKGGAKVLHHLFRGELMIYLVCHRTGMGIKKVQEKLDMIHLPYTSLTEITAPEELEEVVNLPNVVRYFYHHSHPDRVTIRIGKGLEVDNMDEVLGGL